MTVNLQRSNSNLRTEQKISKAKLKWFNAAKGFGFVVPDDNPVDAFIHVTQLQKLGVHCLGNGAEVLCVVEQRDKGTIVSDIVEILSMGETPEAAALVEPPEDGVYKIKGLVKLYFEDKGFGFVTPDDGMKDIFVHKSCLDRCGVEALYPGQSVRISYKLASKGREAILIEVEGTP